MSQWREAASSSGLWGWALLWPDWCYCNKIPCGVEAESVPSCRGSILLASGEGRLAAHSLVGMHNENGCLQKAPSPGGNPAAYHSAPGRTHAR